jgi:D-hexose-6-phosphate mutarotase
VWAELVVFGSFHLKKPMSNPLPNRCEIPGHVYFIDGNNDLPKVVINTAWSSAELYLHGGQVTHFQKKGEPPVLWMSQLSRFENKVPIRGGIPLIFPWFGSREGQASHGFARNQDWELKEISQKTDGPVCLHLGLPDCPEASLWTPFKADLWVTVGKTLGVELIMSNTSESDELTFETCFHTYFHVSQIQNVGISGLKGAEYLDQCDKMARKTEQNEAIRVDREVDRIYFDTKAAVEIQDAGLKRAITIDKEGSLSTVVWNPWIAKAQRMPDFGNDEYLSMVCVESGNVADNAVTLLPGKQASLKIELGTRSL